jgi:hypothetical protein
MMRYPKLCEHGLHHSDFVRRIPPASGGSVNRWVLGSSTCRGDFR